MCAGFFLFVQCGRFAMRPRVGCTDRQTPQTRQDVRFTVPDGQNPDKTNVHLGSRLGDSLNKNRNLEKPAPFTWKGKKRPPVQLEREEPYQVKKFLNGKSWIKFCQKPFSS